MESKDPEFVRVWINDKGGFKFIELFSLAENLKELGVREVYYKEDLNTMPEWLVDRIQKLMIMPLPPPPIPVANIGRRMSENVFWVYIPYEELNHGT